MEEFKNEVIMQLQNNETFNSEMLMMVDQAISYVMRSYQIQRM